MSKTFFPINDVGFLQKMQGDLYRKSFKKIPIWFREPEDGFDFLYIEDTDQLLASGQKVQIPAYIHLEPQKSALKKFGIEDHRDLMIHFSMDNLAKEKCPIPRTGCVTVINQEYYLITDVNPQHYLGHTGKYATLIAFCVKQKVSLIEPLVEVPDSVPDKHSVFAPKNDFGFIEKTLENAHRKSYRKIIVAIRSNDHQHDTFYGEPESENWSGKRFEIDGYANLTPQKSTLRKYGLSKERVVMAVFSKKILDSANVKLSLGDFLIIENEPYSITYIYPKYYFGNTENPFELVVFGMKYRPSSIEDVKVDDDPLYG